MDATLRSGDNRPAGAGGGRRRRGLTGRRGVAALAAVTASTAMLAGAPVAASAALATAHGAAAPRLTVPQVLRVGTWHGIPGQYTTVQAAVDAAHAGDWVLVAPGDYHESPSSEVGVW